MSNVCPDHYSHKFKFNIDKTPVKAVDRFSRFILLMALVLGVLLCLLGGYRFLGASIDGVADIERSLPQTRIAVHSFVSPAVFNVLLGLLGGGIVLVSLLLWFRKKEIFFDGTNFIVRNNPILSASYSFEENLYNYTGVRLRVKFYQYGIMNKNKFIIELYHKDPAKIIPLYITTKKHNIREIWRNYAQKLHMPGITISEKGMVSHNFKDLSRPYREVVAQWHLPRGFSMNLDKPENISFKSRKSGEKMLKVRHVLWDVFSYLSLGIIALCGAGLFMSWYSHAVLVTYIPQDVLLFVDAFLMSVILYLLLNLMARDIIIVTKEKIFVFRKIGLLRIRDGIINIRDIKGVDINYIPTLDRYFLAIVSDKQALIAGSKLPVDSLRWMRAVLINEILGN